MAFAFRPMTVADLPNLLRWMAADHAQPWFGDEPRTIEGATARYGQQLDRTSPMRMWIAEFEGRDIGFLQDYPVRAYDDYAVRVQDPEAVAFDYLIGEPDLVDRGIGTQMITAFCRDILCAQPTLDPGIGKMRLQSGFVDPAGVGAVS